MATLRGLWRDSDRLPYLHVVKHAASAYGLDLQLAPARGREYAEILLGGDCDVLLENYWNLQSYRARGEPLACVASALNRRNEKLLARDGVADIQDLRGGRLAVRGQRPTDLIEPLWVKDAGLEDDLEVVLVPESETGRWGVWRKVVQGEADAAIVTNLYADEALAAGLHEIPMPLDPYGFLGSVVYTTTRANVAGRHQEIESLVRAAFDAALLFRDDPRTVMELMSHIPAEEMKAPMVTLESTAKIESVYRIIRDELAYPPAPTLDAISNFHRMTLLASQDLADFNPLLMWDLSLASAVADERRA
jgi:hypothetical protein